MHPIIIAVRNAIAFQVSTPITIAIRNAIAFMCLAGSKLLFVVMILGVQVSGAGVATQMSV